jgi:O-antigen/teichoic acid export membrane protein
MILSAHQRFETYNLAQALLFGLGLLCLWIGFRSGLGIFSLMWAQGITQILGTAVAVVVCFRAKLFPAAGRWGRPGWRWFWELFSYGRDMFLFSAGNLLINFSQTILITRVAGLEVAAVWAVCTRTFFLSLQIVTRLSDYAWSALAEMMVRSERERLLSRFQSMAIFSASVSVVAGVAFGLGNQPFVEWWTGGRIGWSAINDWLLAAWLVILTFTRSHIGLAGLTKQFRFLRYLYFVEGLFSVGLGYVALRLAGPTGMLVVFVCGSLFVSFSYGVWRTSDYFKLTWSRTAFGWLWPAFRLACLLVPLGLAISWLVKTWPPSMRFILLTGFVGVTGLVPLFRWGLDGALRKEIGARLPSMSPRWQTWFVRLTNISPPASRTDRRG